MSDGERLWWIGASCSRASLSVAVIGGERAQSLASALRVFVDCCGRRFAVHASEDVSALAAVGPLSIDLVVLVDEAGESIGRLPTALLSGRTIAVSPRRSTSTGVPTIVSALRTREECEACARRVLAAMHALLGVDTGTPRPHLFNF